MVPFAQSRAADLANNPVLIVSGQRDPIIPESNSAKLAKLLTEAGANVQHPVLPVGHELSQSDLTIGREWIKTVHVLQKDPATLD